MVFSGAAERLREGERRLTHLTCGDTLRDSARRMEIAGSSCWIWQGLAPQDDLIRNVEWRILPKRVSLGINREGAAAVRASDGRDVWHALENSADSDSDVFEYCSRLCQQDDVPSTAEL
jgi:hypothetical protein